MHYFLLPPVLDPILTLNPDSLPLINVTGYQLSLLTGNIWCRKQRPKMSLYGAILEEAH
jgi:hypothetical protein